MRGRELGDAIGVLVLHEQVPCAVECQADRDVELAERGSEASELLEVAAIGAVDDHPMPVHVGDVHAAVRAKRHLTDAAKPAVCLAVEVAKMNRGCLQRMRRGGSQEEDENEHAARHGRILQRAPGASRGARLADGLRGGSAMGWSSRSWLTEKSYTCGPGAREGFPPAGSAARARRSRCDVSSCG